MCLPNRAHRDSEQRENTKQRQLGKKEMVRPLLFPFQEG